MKKRIVVSLLAATIVISLGACGNPDKPDGSERDKSVHQAVVKTEEGVEGYRMKTNIGKTGKNDDLSKLTGCFIETVDGKENAYVSINDKGATSVSNDTMAPTPLGIEANEKGLMVYRAVKPKNAEYVAYTFDGKTLKFEVDKAKYEWKKVDFFKIDGNFNYKRMDGKGSEVWSFYSDGTGSYADLSKQTAKYNDFKFKQDKDKLVVTYDDGVTDEYKYQYDITTLYLDMDGIVIDLKRN